MDVLKPHTITLQPFSPGDSFKIEFRVLVEGPALVQAVEGVCKVNGELCYSHQSQLHTGEEGWA